MSKAIDRIKAEWNANPLTVIGVAGLAASAAAKLIDSVSAVQGRRAYAKSVNLRAKSRK